MKFTSAELKDLTAAWLMISLAFAILLSGADTIFINPMLFFLSFAIAALTAGIGFLLHEVMHKYVAQQYGLMAEFRAFYNMLFLAIALSFFGFIIAAPGAVIIQSYRGYISREKNGKISLAGPMTNILLAVLFLALILLFKPTGIFNMMFSYGLTINSLLALFNLIPFIPFDGKKVWDWNKSVYFASVAAALFLFLIREFV